MKNPRFGLLTPAVVALLKLPKSAPRPIQATDKRPNFLFIIADDQSPFDLKAYNPSSPLQTPVLDQLAAQSMVSMLVNEPPLKTKRSQR